MAEEQQTPQMDSGVLFGLVVYHNDVSLVLIFRNLAPRLSKTRKRRNEP